MKNIFKLGLIALIASMIFIVPVYGSKPLKLITGHCWFESDFISSPGDICGFSVSARETSTDIWIGHGTLIDQDSGEKVIASFENGDYGTTATSWYIWLWGPGKLHINNEVHTGTVTLYYEEFSDHQHISIVFEETSQPTRSWGTFIGLSGGKINLK